jgi:hypothetical protein
MASGGKRRGGGERVLEGRHVIGLFMLMLLFSGLFFTLGYVMGRDQYDGQVRAATNLRGSPDRDILPKSEVAPRPSSKRAAPEARTDAVAPSTSDWEFYHAGDSNRTDDRLKPAVSTAAVPAAGKGVNSTKQVNAAAKTNVTAPLSAGWNLQVSATTHEADAMALAWRWRILCAGRIFQRLCSRHGATGFTMFWLDRTRIRKPWTTPGKASRWPGSRRPS